MAEASGDGDEPAKVESLYPNDYRRETLNAALALPKWHRVRQPVVLLQALRMQEAVDIEICFQQYAAIGLPGFASRGGTIRVVSIGTYDYLGQAQVLDACLDEPF
ncbi:hypothetical protein EXIGLDRAFT_843900 [Exidia glandulosa HHB12029]|uniref:Uncharacterized protein n=1 Tax=Exidia glandulosa HHB12029 TaxID=1314781 RepID=A0A165CCW8_EXIGL|nr:hypothetical protein EXIGLDRAFT_843900 [Exidia glandulosa HHB12029]